MTISPRRLGGCLVFALVATTLSGCISIRAGRFKPSVAQRLVLGETTESEITALLGSNAELRDRHVEDAHVTLDYADTKTHPAIFGIEIETKLLTVELVDGRLRGFEASEFEAPALEAGAIRASLRLGATPEELIERLGEPSGRALCPSHLFPRCTEGQRWRYRGEVLDASIDFDASGRASEVWMTRGPGAREELPAGFPFSPSEAWLEAGETGVAAIETRLGMPVLQKREGDDGALLVYRQVDIVGADGTRRRAANDLAVAFAASSVGELDGKPTQDPRLQVRILTLDVRQGVLQGFFFASNAPEDAVPVPDTAALALGLSKAEVEARVGRRHSDVLCPSRWAPYCHEGSAWIFLPPLERVLGEPDADSRAPGVALVFGADGELQQIVPLPGGKAVAAP